MVTQQALHTASVKSPSDVAKEYQSRLDSQADAWMTTIEAEIRKWWTNLLQDVIVIEMPAFMAPDLKLMIIDRLKERQWSVREGNNGRYLLIDADEWFDGEFDGEGEE